MPRAIELEQVNMVFVAVLGDFFEPDFRFEPNFWFGPTSGPSPLPVWAYSRLDLLLVLVLTGSYPPYSNEIIYVCFIVVFNY